MSGIIYKGKNYSAMNTSAVATKENQENQALTLESIQAQITALQEAIAKIPTTSGGGIKQVIHGTFTMSGVTSKTISHESVDVSKSFVIIDGIGMSSSADATINSDINSGLRITSRTSTSITVASASTHNTGFYVTGGFSYQIVEFN